MKIDEKQSDYERELHTQFVIGPAGHFSFLYLDD